MRVEAPTTMMQAYQQGRANRRQDRLDEQKLAFDVFDESRARKKHELQMDTGIENLRNKKTMNPLMESLALYKNKLAYGTLDADIAENAEISDNLIKQNRIKQAKMLSDLDALQTKRLQQDYLPQTGSVFSTGATPEILSKREESAGYRDELVSKGLLSGIQDLDIDMALNRPVQALAEETAKWDEDFREELPEEYYDLAGLNYTNKFEYPIRLLDDQNQLSTLGYEKAFDLYDIEDKRLKDTKENLETFTEQQKSIKELLKAPKQNKDAINDAMNTLKIYRELFGFGQGGLMNLQGVTGGK